MVRKLWPAIGTALAVLWFAANLLLWHLHPSELVWLVASAVLAAVGVKGFLWYILNGPR